MSASLSTCRLIQRFLSPFKKSAGFYQMKLCSLFVLGISIYIPNILWGSSAEHSEVPVLTIQPAVVLDYGESFSRDFVLEASNKVEGPWVRVDPIVTTVHNGKELAVVLANTQCQYFRLTPRINKDDIYHIFLNGTVCITWPCPQWTARRAGHDMTFDSLDIAPLGLPEQESRKLMAELGEGKWLVNGTFVDGPVGPAGTSNTLKILELVGKRVVLSTAEPRRLQMDPFTLKHVSLEGAIMKLGVNYSGGCHSHEFRLFMSPPVFQESFPVQAKLWLQHENDDDPCDAIVSDELAFDISPILDLYRKQYGKDAPIRLNVFGYFDSEPLDGFTVLYKHP